MPGPWSIRLSAVAWSFTGMIPMPAFHCPLGSVYYDDEPCIACGLCQAQTEKERVEASRKMREYIRAHAGRKSRCQKMAVCGKGGTGKSTLVALLANVFRQEGYAVLVMDSDESNPGLPRLLGLGAPATSLASLLERFSSGDRKPGASWLDAARISTEGIPREYVLSASRLKLLTAGKINDPFQGCACQIADLARDFVQKVNLGSKEIMLIDTEAGIESFGRGVERGVDAVLIVVEPSYDSLALVEKFRYLAEGIGISTLYAVLNKIPSPEMEAELREELEMKGVRLAGTVYLDPQISQAAFRGQKLPDNTTAHAQAQKIAQTILSANEFPSPRGSVLE
jgi:CO dehydrogenase maturation factor